MKLSIWQQFSSNHSSNFMLVGEFISTEAATNAANVLRQIAQSIDRWYLDHEEVRERLLEDRLEVPTEAELQICAQYGIENVQAVDWLANCGVQDDTVLTYDKFVFISNGLCQTDVGDTLFDQVMAKLALHTVVEIEAGPAILVDVTCVHADPQRLEAVHQAMQHYLTLNKDGSAGANPMLGYQTGTRADNADELVRLQEIHQRHQTAAKQWQEDERAWIAENERLRQAALQRQAYDEARRIIAERQAREQEALRDYPDLSLDQLNVLMMAQIATDAEIPWWGNGGIERDDTRISLRKIHFRQLSTGLPNIIAWLEEQGCTDIHFELEQH